VPPLYVTRTISTQRKARPLPVAQREAALAKTADIFTRKRQKPGGRLSRRT
jgi:hypothetical protein